RPRPAIPLTDRTPPLHSQPKELRRALTLWWRRLMPDYTHSRFPVMSRRGVLASGTAASAFFFSSGALAQGRGQSRSYEPARRLANVDHAVVYRSDTEMVGWPHIMGYWNIGDGEILQQVT